MQGYFKGLMRMTGITFGQESSTGTGTAAPQPIHTEVTTYASPSLSPTEFTPSPSVTGLDPELPGTSSMETHTFDRNIVGVEEEKPKTMDIRTESMNGSVGQVNRKLDRSGINHAKEPAIHEQTVVVEKSGTEREIVAEGTTSRRVKGASSGKNAEEKDTGSKVVLKESGQPPQSVRSLNLPGTRQSPQTPNSLSPGPESSQEDLEFGVTIERIWETGQPVTGKPGKKVPAVSGSLHSSRSPQPSLSPHPDQESQQEDTEFSFTIERIKEKESGPTQLPQSSQPSQNSELAVSLSQSVPYSSYSAPTGPAPVQENREFSLSIGSINVTVEGPQSLPVIRYEPFQQSTPETQQGGNRAEQSSPSRLGRHYLRMRG